MRINKITLNNFGSYAGTNTFDFATDDPTKRVVVIGGKNGAGKTTLFTAIQVCLYGNFAFGYKTSGKVYLKDIFKLLNANARLDDKKTSYVEIVFLQEDRTDVYEYTVRRTWSWTTDDVSEHFAVAKNGEQLEEDELVNFQNYLLHLIPPDMLKLYFFDGERIADYFLKDQELNFKDALMVLSGNDTFEIIYENVRRVMKAAEENKDDSANEYLSAKDQYAQLQERLKRIDEEISLHTATIEESVAAIDQLNQTYRERGGISLEEWAELHEKLKEEESKRERLNHQRKVWATDILPFAMLESFVDQVIPQIEEENQYIANKALQERLSENALQNMLVTLAKDLGCEDSRKGGRKILTQIKDYLLDSKWESFKPTLGLSSDEARQVISTIQKIKSVDPKIAQKFQHHINSSLERTKSVRAQIQSSDVEHFEEHIREISKFEETKNVASLRKDHALEALEILQQQLLEQESLLKRTKKALEEQLKKQSVAATSGRVLLLLEELQTLICDELVKTVERDLNEKFHQLFRKKDFFSRIVVENDFSVHVLRDQEISRTDLISMLQSSSLTPLYNAIGKYAVEELMRILEVHTKSELSAMVRMTPKESYILPVTLDKQRFSSGEKQIFVMALYWSMMHQSKSSLPYIIDTPFARIDTEHRANIIKHFFKSLPGQLIVLSTDEEISNRHLRNMEEQISTVYMLEYGSDKCTHIYRNQYFEGVN